MIFSPEAQERTAGGGIRTKRCSAVMKVIEKTDSRLAIKLGLPLLWSTSCTLDKERGLADFESRALALLVRREEFALADILEAYVRKKHRRGSTAYTAVVTLKSGHQLELNTLGPDEAKDAIRKITQFLN